MSSQPIGLGVGTFVWFHSRDMAEHATARAAYVNGSGAHPGAVNLTVLANQVLDVLGGKLPPLIQRRNVPVFQAYPKEWPMTDFAVWPGTGALHLGKPGEAPRGGVPPKVVAGVVTMVEPFAKADAHLSSTGVGENGVDVEPTVKPQAPQPALRIAGSDQAESVATSTPQEPPTNPAPKPEKVETSKTLTGERKVETIDHAMSLLMKHPAWSREFDENPCTLASSADEQQILILSTSSIRLAVLTHNQDTSMGKRGYLLYSKLFKSGNPIVDGLNKVSDISKMISIAGRIGREGAAAKTTAEAKKAVEKAVGYSKEQMTDED